MVGQNEDIALVKKRLLSTDGLNKRIALLDEADILRSHLAARLSDLQYDAEAVKVHIPSVVACAWWCAATNEKGSMGGVTRALKQSISEGRIKWLIVNPHIGHGTGFLWGVGVR